MQSLKGAATTARAGSGGGLGGEGGGYSTDRCRGNGIWRGMRSVRLTPAAVAAPLPVAPGRVEPATPVAVPAQGPVGDPQEMPMRQAG